MYFVTPTPTLFNNFCNSCLHFAVTLHHTTILVTTKQAQLFIILFHDINHVCYGAAKQLRGLLRTFKKTTETNCLVLSYSNVGTFIYSTKEVMSVSTFTFGPYARCYCSFYLLVRM